MTERKYSPQDYYQLQSFHGAANTVLDWETAPYDGDLYTLMDASPQRASRTLLSLEQSAKDEASIYQQRAAQVEQKVLQLDVARTIANRYAAMNPDISRKERKRRTRQATTAVYELLKIQDGEEPRDEALKAFEQPEAQPFVFALHTIQTDIEQKTIDTAHAITALEGQKIVRNAAMNMLKLRYSRQQAREVLDSAGLTPEQCKKFMRMVVKSAPTSVALNLLLGQGGEAAAAWIGLVQSSDEILNFMRSLDPQLRGMIAVALPVITQAAVYWATDLKNKMSIELYENGIEYVPDPNIVADYVLHEKVTDPKDEHLLTRGRWRAHFMGNPSALLDEKWYLTLLIGDYGITFSMGNAIALMLKLGAIGVSKGAIYFKKKHEKNQASTDVAAANGTSGNGYHVDPEFMAEFIVALADENNRRMILQDYGHLLLQKPRESGKKSIFDRRSMAPKIQDLTRSGD